ncbi:hypothetical protein BH09ACT7_BH09ACT7_58400 [soil metagenome]
MKVFAVRVSSIVGMAVVAFALIGSGTAAAKTPYAGLTWGVASAKVADKGGKAVISTVVGSELPTDECVVMSARRSSYTKRDGFDHERAWLFALNCNAKLAHGGEPGNSLASPEGRAQEKLESTAAKINAGASKPGNWCAQNLEKCQKFCDTNAGLCSKDIMALF